ncbi:outer membrane autotransporter barrel domain-containing protein [Pseudomonas cuatrocienegasensis]|uniref:Outer membrane autotransporter barrel domain-containing protein n=1 Tax=Pseudomonas cuatrocienegasensis TaxID=543360 RepID=A0ABY1BNG3_9PSED|nr:MULTISPECIES: autotransporter domain-containing protein [Pseudomonas]OEC33687.1 autotransporter outer membrane beta-barrel domain-containing protein [Pseudomonas sp. 21C1]SER25086.1 outer membrane autotransporter barrel domain-containing protein [Pseudomonas cuatrocienegasensis]
MIKPLALTIGLTTGLLSQMSLAYEYGEYAADTLETLINDYPGRYRGTTNFAGAADWMEQRMSPGYSASRQDFSWVAGGTTRSSQNVIVQNTGISGRNLIVGAHFDTFFGRPTLQGLDDNGSGAGVLSEIARNLAGIDFEDGVTFIGFGAEEEGLRGSNAYLASLDAEARSALTGMINIDSLITGDMMYAHAGSDSVGSSELTALRDHILQIASEMGIELNTNPGLNSDYPAGTGCCSDGDSFLGLGIPVLYMESTNWDIGDLDGYEQTTNPAIPGGSTWHNPTLDNETVLVGAFGEERIAQRLRDYSRLLTRLVLEATQTDLRYSALSGAALLGTLEDTLTRQQQSLAQVHDLRWIKLRSASRAVGSIDGAVGIEGQASPQQGFDSEPDQRSHQASAYAMADIQLTPTLNLGASLSFSRSKDSLDHGGKVDGDTWQAGLYGSLQDDSPLWLNADVSAGRTSFDMTRAVFIQGNGGPIILDQKLDGKTDALFWGGRLLGGYDFAHGNLSNGPMVGIDYHRYTLDGYREKSSLRTALRTERTRFDSAELSIGWQVYGALPLNTGKKLLPYASLAWVEELADGFSEDFELTSPADGSVRRIDNGRATDKHFARARLGAQLSLSHNLALYAQASGRLQHTDGDQTAYSAGVQFAF